MLDSFDFRESVALSVTHDELQAFCRDCIDIVCEGYDIDADVKYALSAEGLPEITCVKDILPVTIEAIYDFFTEIRRATAGITQEYVVNASFAIGNALNFLAFDEFHLLYSKEILDYANTDSKRFSIDVAKDIYHLKDLTWAKFRSGACASADKKIGKFIRERIDLLEREWPELEKQLDAF